MNTDDMVREALADLAPDAPADSSALAGFHRAIHRRRRRQTVARVAAAVAVLAMAVGAGALLLHAEDDPADFGTDEHGQDGKPTTDSTGTPKPDLGGRITFGEVRFQLPPGWEAGTPTKETDPETGAEGETMCIAPAGNEGRQFDGCAGLILHRGDFLPGNEMRPYQPHDNWAWSHSTDPPSCPTLGEPTADQPFDQAMAPDGTGSGADRRRRAHGGKPHGHLRPLGRHVPVGLQLPAPGLVRARVAGAGLRHRQPPRDRGHPGLLRVRGLTGRGTWPGVKRGPTVARRVQPCAPRSRGSGG